MGDSHLRPLRAVVGTAGHIDHGKTALVRALTGIDCDRLPEEKARGITIDLGFAHGEWDAVRFGFVDVPGHERFVRNMLAGATGIDLALLVVAADESVMPQTREHLDICSLLGIPAGVVVLTKADRVDADTLELVRLEVAALVEGTFLAGAEVLAASAVTGEGLDAVRAALARGARSAAVAQARAGREQEPVRLPVDRAFVVKGFGPVVTGTLVSGTVREGDRLALFPEGRDVRVRGIQVHGEGRNEAVAGERTSLNLSGVDIADLRRGETVAVDGSLAVVRMPTVEVTALASLARPVADGTRVRFHLGAAEVPGRLRLPGGGELRPGESRLAQLGLDAPVALLAGDRFVLRSLSPVATLAGGRVLDPALRRLGSGDPQLEEVDRILRRGSAVEKVTLLAARGGERGIAAASLGSRLGGPVAARGAAIRDAIATGGVVDLAGYLVGASTVAALEARGKGLLAELAAKDRTRTSLPRSEFTQRLSGRLPPAAREALVERWAGSGAIAVDREKVMLPGRSAGLAGGESASAERIVAAYDAAGLAAAPSPDAVARELGIKPQIAQGLVRHLVDSGRLVRLPGDWIVARTAVDDLAARLVASGLETIDVGAFKELSGLTRKLAIPMLEYFDRVGVTRREGERRRIVRPQ